MGRTVGSAFVVSRLVHHSGGHHWWLNHPADRTACWQPISERTLVTDDFEEVTCGRCAATSDEAVAADVARSRTAQGLPHELPDEDLVAIAAVIGPTLADPPVTHRSGQ